MTCPHIGPDNSHYAVIIVGGGQAGLSMSYYLQQADIDHVIIEQSTLVNAWKEKRWDSFTLVTPNWQCDLPGPVSYTHLTLPTIYSV